MFEDQYFERKKLNISKLIDYGFAKEDDKYKYSAMILNNKFSLDIIIDSSGNVHTEVTDADTKEEYILYKVENAVGEFVNSIRNECEKMLIDISDKCYEPDIFKTEQTKNLIKYVKTKYNDELEFLWTKFPDNAVWRRKDTKKWYAVILTVSKRKLGLKSDEIVEIIDLRAKPEQIKTIVDNRLYFPGWHMNKKSWYTIILDSSVTTEDICKKIDYSYQLATK